MRQAISSGLALAVLLSACEGGRDASGRDASPPVGGDGDGRPPVHSSPTRPETQAFQGGIAVRSLDDAFPEEDFSVSGAVIAAGSGEPAPPVNSLLFGAGGRPSHPVAWLTIADETTEVTLRYALPWRVAVPTLGERATVTGRWQDWGEGQPPIGYFVWRDTTGTLQLLVAGDFEFPNEPDLAFAVGAKAGEFRSDCRTETLFDLAVSHDGTESEVPYGGRQQVGPFVILHGDLWTAATENCSEWNPRRLLRIAAVRGELSTFEAEAGGPCGGGHCAADEVCRLPPAAACDFGHADARCVPRPALADCPIECAPVCDCAGRAHCNVCAAEHRGATVAADETACLTCFGSGQGSAGRCAQFWECDGREARVTCSRPAEDAPAECECMLDQEVVDRVPYAPEFCRVEDMAAACRFVRPEL